MQHIVVRNRSAGKDSSSHFATNWYSVFTYKRIQV